MSDGEVGPGVVELVLLDEGIELPPLAGRQVDEVNRADLVDHGHGVRAADEDGAGALLVDDEIGGHGRGPHRGEAVNVPNSADSVAALGARRWASTASRAARSRRFVRNAAALLVNAVSAASRSSRRAVWRCW